MTATILQHPHLWTRRVVIARRGRLVRAGLRFLLESQPGLEVVGETGDAAAAIDMAHALRPQTVLLDVNLPGLDWIEATQRIVAKSSVAVVVMSPWRSQDLVADALTAGAESVVLEDEDPTQLFDALCLSAPAPKEEPMLSPNVVEIRRGAAHCQPVARSSRVPGNHADVRLVKFPTRHERGAQSWNSVI